MRIDIKKTLIPRETTIFILINCRIFSVVKNQSLSFELKVDTTELRKLDFWKFQSKRGGVGLQHKKSSNTRTERAPGQSRSNKKSSTSRTGRAPDQQQENKREGWSLLQAISYSILIHLYLQFLLILNCNFIYVLCQSRKA